MALNTIKPNAYLSTYIFGGAAAVAAAAQQRRHHQPDMQSYIAVGMRVPPIQAYALLTGSAWQCWWDTLHMTSSSGGGGGGEGGSSAAAAAAMAAAYSPSYAPATALESTELS